jgi:signal transduction histidine kinase
MASLTVPSDAPNVRQAWASWWAQITEPSTELTDLSDRRQARLLASLLITFGAIGVISILLLPVINPVDQLNFGTLLSLLLLVIPYALSRTRYYRIATVLMLLLAAGAIIYPALTNLVNTDPVISLQFLTLLILLSSLLLDKRSVIIVTALIIAGLLVISELDYMVSSVSAPIIMMVVTSALLLVFMSNRDALERDGQHELQTALVLAESSIQSELETNMALEAKNQELARANAMIKETTRLKSEFLSTMSHELRTPLNAIRGFTGILLEGMGGEIDEEARHMLVRVDANSERLLNLINDVLDIARIEAGRMELVSEPLNPLHLATQWQAQMSVLAEQKGIGFEVHIDPELPEVVMGDGQRITQIATNLLSNAFKFTKEGKVSLYVRSEADTWVISVKDTGIGIPPHALNYIFEEFRQVDGTSKRQFGGTGLGLAISRTISRTMGGNISVRSELGVGSEFTVTLPLEAQANLQSAALVAEPLS